MTEPGASKPTPTVQIGSLKVTGPLALVAAVAIVGVVVSLIIWSRPSVGMLLPAASGWASWCSGASPRNVAAGPPFESRRDRAPCISDS